MLDSPETLHAPLERIVVLKNPVSKNGARGQRQLADLVEFSSLPFDVVETDIDPGVTASRLSLLEPTDMLYVIGGDGTVNHTLEPLMKHQALLLPTRSGNANDLAMSMNGRRAPWKVYADYIEGDADEVKVHPIEVTVRDEQSFTTNYGINYASFGYAALASHYLNQPWSHAGLKSAYDRLPHAAQSVARLPREGFLLAKAAADASTYTFKPEGSEGPQLAADISFVHSERMAKLGRFNVRHTDDVMFFSVLPDSSVMGMGKEFFKMMRAKMAGTYIAGLTFEIENQNPEGLYYQVDGEAVALPQGVSSVGVGLAGSSVRLLTTRL